MLAAPAPANDTLGLATLVLALTSCSTAYSVCLNTASPGRFGLEVLGEGEGEEGIAVTDKRHRAVVMASMPIQDLRRRMI